MTQYPLEGIRIVDLSQIYNGPYATYLLALGGAEVIKIEPPGGESLRRRAAVGGAALPFAMLNGCKRSVVLNLKTPEGKEALEALVAEADVLVENFAPGVMDRLGVGADRLMALNPRLIYASSSGFGRDGPYSKYPAMDLTVQAMGGIINITGFPDQPPVKAGPAMADFFAGIHLYGAITTALFERERTGIARRLEVAMQDAVYASLASNLGMHWGGEGDASLPARTGNRHGGLAEAPYNVYPTADGYIAIICVGEAHWRSLARLMGAEALADDERFATLKARVEHMDLIDATVTDWTSRHPSSALFEQMMAAHVPCAPVRTLDEVVADANMHARGALAWIEHPEYGRIVVQQSPFRFDGVPRIPLAPSRPLGADTQDILGKRAGFTSDRIAQAVAASK
ncbi:CoA transferase [Novosphingobium sp. FGD1]|uniref:CoA transferase n=1 Tax=Novosphingobium silvae TaxID=2692619 RepID=A0A7X4KA70_9SPHN|nr:CoA transferase [Novosphingobium silvae]MYM00149.1 CoA transferase [Novosphingobium silvae]